MRNVLTLVSNPLTRILSTELAGKAAEALRSAGADVGDTHWLAEGLAADIPFERVNREEAEAVARAALGEAPIDLLGQIAAERRRRLLLADMDSTVITTETVDELAAEAGIAEEVKAITAKTMHGEIPFEESIRQRILLLQGLPLQMLDNVVGRLALSPGARTLVRTLRAHGCFTVLVSGGFTFCTEPVAELCGFHEQHANVLLHENQRLTGHVREPILGRGAKKQILHEIAKQRRIKLEEACAIGDGANDIDMIQEVGLGVAYRGKPLVREAARAKIDHGDLSTLLFFQGFDETELVL